MKIIIIALFVIYISCENKTLNLQKIKAIEFSFTDLNKTQIKKLYNLHQSDSVLNSFYNPNLINNDTILNQTRVNKLNLFNFFEWDEFDLDWQNRPEIISITFFMINNKNIIKILNNRDLEKFENLKKIFN